MTLSLSRRGLVALSVLVIATTSATSSPALAAIDSEDEDGYVQVRPTNGHTTGWGTAALNQVVRTQNGAQVGNVLTGWMTLYGLKSRTRYALRVTPGRRCGADRDAASSTRTIRTNSHGGWQGTYRLTIRRPAVWVVRGAYRLDVRKQGGGRVACGRMVDDPDIGN